MGLNSFTKQAFLAVESEYGGTGGTPDRAIVADFAITPVVNTADIAANASGSKLEVDERVKVGTLTNVSITGTMRYEYFPLFAGMLLGGGSDLVKTILDPVTDPNASAGSVDNPTNPNSVAQFISEVLVTAPVLPNHYSLYFTDGTDNKVIRGFFATNLVINAPAGQTATFTLTAQGHYPDDTNTPLVNIAKISQATPVVVTNQITTIAGTRLNNAVKSTTITLPSGLTPLATSDGGFNANGTVSGRRNAQIQVTTNNDADAKAIRATNENLGRASVEVEFVGTQIRETAPQHSRTATIQLYGQLTDSGEQYPDDNGEFINTFTFDSIADDNGHDVTADITVANDDGGLV